MGGSAPPEESTDKQAKYMSVMQKRTSLVQIDRVAEVPDIEAGGDKDKDSGGGRESFRRNSITLEEQQHSFRSDTNAPPVAVDHLLTFDDTLGHLVSAVNEGCIIGMPLLRGHSLTGCKWKPSSADADLSDGMPCNISVQVVGRKLVYSSYSIETFERLFGAHPLTHTKVPEAKLGASGFGFAKKYRLSKGFKMGKAEYLGGAQESSRK